jgi:cell division protein FtsQ
VRGSSGLEAPPEVVHFEGDADAESGAAINSWKLVVLLKVIVGAVLVAGLTVGLFWSLYRYAVSSPRFAIKTISVAGNQRVSDARVAELSGLQLGANIFKSDTTSAQQRLLEEPWIQSAQIARELPGRVQIKVTERTAVALASVGEDLFLVTPQGEPFKKVEPGETFDLALITGLSLTEMARDRDREMDRMRTAIDVLGQYARLDMSHAQPPQEVALHDDGRVTLVVGSRGIHLELGREAFRSKLLMAGRVLARLSAKGGQPEVLFLDNEAHPERVVVRLR